MAVAVAIGLDLRRLPGQPGRPHGPYRRPSQRMTIPHTKEHQPTHEHSSEPHEPRPLAPGCCWRRCSPPAAAAAAHSQHRHQPHHRRQHLGRGGANTSAGSGTGGGSFPGASGSVAAITGSSMEVQNQQTGQVTVSWTSSTTFSKTVTLSAAQCGRRGLRHGHGIHLHRDAGGQHGHGQHAYLLGQLHHRPLRRRRPGRRWRVPGRHPRRLGAACPTPLRDRPQGDRPPAAPADSDSPAARSRPSARPAW